LGYSGEQCRQRPNNKTAFSHKNLQQSEQSIAPTSSSGSRRGFCSHVRKIRRITVREMKSDFPRILIPTLPPPLQILTSQSWDIKEIMRIEKKIERGRLTRARLNKH
jgi:hypothetical protein